MLRALLVDTVSMAWPRGPLLAGLVCVLVLSNSAGAQDSRTAKLDNASKEGIGQARGLQGDYGELDGNIRGTPSDNDMEEYSSASTRSSDGTTTAAPGTGVKFLMFEIATSIFVFVVSCCCILAYACVKCRSRRQEADKCCGENECRCDGKSQDSKGDCDSSAQTNTSEKGLEEGKTRADESPLDDIVPSAPDAAEPQVCAENGETNAHPSAESQEVKPGSADMDVCIEQLEGVMPAAEVSESSAHKAGIGNEDEAAPGTALHKMTTNGFYMAPGVQSTKTSGGCITGIVSACGSNEMFYGKPSSARGRL